MSYLRVIKEVATCDVRIRGFKARNKVRLIYLKVKNKNRLGKRYLESEQQKAKYD